MEPATSNQLAVKLETPTLLTTGDKRVMFGSTEYETLEVRTEPASSAILSMKTEAVPKLIPKGTLATIELSDQTKTSAVVEPKRTLVRETS